MKVQRLFRPLFVPPRKTDTERVTESPQCTTSIQFSKFRKIISAQKVGIKFKGISFLTEFQSASRPSKVRSRSWDEPNRQQISGWKIAPERKTSRVGTMMITPGATNRRRNEQRAKPPFFFHFRRGRSAWLSLTTQIDVIIIAAAAKRKPEKPLDN